jgi:hypothetical protein
VDRLLQSLLAAIQTQSAMSEEEHKRSNAVPADLVSCLPFIRNCDSKKSCTVCQELATEGEVLLELPCEHAFHSQCILPWLEQQHTCPTCRAEITPESVEEASAGRVDNKVTEEALRKLPVKELKRRLQQQKVSGWTSYASPHTHPLIRIPSYASPHP